MNFLEQALAEIAVDAVGKVVDAVVENVTGHATSHEEELKHVAVLGGEHD